MKKLLCLSALIVYVFACCPSSATKPPTPIAGPPTVQPSPVPSEPTDTPAPPPAPTEIPLPTDTPVPTPVPTNTPKPTKFQIGQDIYLVPSMEEIESGRAVFRWSDLIGFFQRISSCDDFSSHEPEKTWIYHNQQGEVTDVMVCGDNTYYLIKVEDAGSIYHAWEDWLSKEQLSGEPISPVGLPFYLYLASDSEEPRKTDPFLPAELAYYEGQEAKTAFNGQAARLILNSIQDVDEYCTGRFSTSFTLFNDGTEEVNFNTKEAFQAAIHKGYVFGTYGRASQEVSPDVSIQPGQSADFEIVWDSPRSRNGKLCDEQVIYIAVNSSPILPRGEVSVFVYENSVFFRLYLPEKKVP